MMVGYPPFQLFFPMSDNSNNVDKNSFAFLFNEDIYVIPEKNPETTISQKEVKVSKEKVTEEKKIEPVKKEEKEIKIPSIPKIPAVSMVKEYAVLINTPQELETGKEFLSKILGAIKLDFTKVDLYSSEADSESALSKAEHSCFIAFGLNALNHQLEYNRLVKKGKSTMLFSQSLSELQKDVPKKKALWEALQQLLK